MEAASLNVMHVLATLQRRGAETFATDLMRALTGLDVEQSVVVLRDGELAVDTASIRVLRLSSGGYRIPRLNAEGPVVSGLAGAIEADRPDVIQTHGGEALKHTVLAARWGVRRRARSPIVYRRIGTSPSWLRGPRRVAYATMMRRASKVVTVADAVRAELITTFHISPDHVVSIPNGVDPARVRPRISRRSMREALALPASAPVTLSFGALTWEKNPLVHVEIARRVIDAVPNAMHVFLGDGPERTVLERRIDELGLAERVRVLGSRGDVGDVLAAVDVVLFASRGDGMEGMPATVIEAGMAGVPVAAFPVAGVSEVVSDRETGFLAPVGDIDGLAQRIVELMQEPHLRVRMGEAAAARCHERFSIDTVASSYRSLYEEVAALDRKPA
jgi:glycosyltransferase involved in cell wall biosynthesis